MTVDEIIKKLPQEEKTQLETLYNSIGKLQGSIKAAMIILGCVLAVVAAVIVALKQYMLLFILLSFGGVTCAVVIGILFLAIFVKQNELDMLFSKQVVPHIINAYFSEYYYNEHEGFNKTDVLSSRLYKNKDFDDFSSSKYLSTSYKGVYFQQANVNLEKDDSENSSKTIFKGCWMIVGFNKEFSTDLIIYEDNSKMKPDKTGLQKVEFENIEFNEKFEVYAENTHNAYYILTPHFMESILKFEKLYKGFLSLSFRNGKISVALNNGQTSLSIKPMGQFSLEKIIRYASRDLALVTEIIDELKLSDKIFAN